MERAIIIIIIRLYSTVQHFTQRKYKHLSRNTIGPLEYLMRMKYSMLEKGSSPGN